ncbi:MAG: glycoside hydrolase family 9 protein [Bacteroidales bacterium]|nr:glycoside hydrolase family 9 protein [Bacteroidales bacterium]
MKNLFLILTVCTLVLATSCNSPKTEWIRINQLGYRTNDIKVAVFLSKETVTVSSFTLLDAVSGKTVMTFDNPTATDPLAPFASCYRLPFTKYTKPGTYRIVAGKAISPDFRIGDDVYDETADFLLNYMRQQRCGYNPYLKDSCHMADGYEIYGKNDDSAHVDATGGWHDAADYLQYVATSANATYQMLFAYSENPGSFADEYLANGLPGPDGVPDVLNESKWGLDWLLRMNPEPERMYNQIADDRDHVGFRFPNHDSANYGKGKERPVYLCTGKPQGLFKHKNRATGIASTAGKFSSAFAIGSEVYKNINPEFSGQLEKKAAEAFEYGLKNPGACQTAPGTAPYFYEEDNWVDDMELAAVELYNLTGQVKYLEYATGFGRQEITTPWIGKDTARHYQWYPFVNMGHPGVARNQVSDNNSEFAGYMKKGLDLTMGKAEKNPFLIGVPFIWCSNNLVAAILTQAHLYSEITGDYTYAELEAAHRDWLFGCNPWGTSMIVGLPENGDYPKYTHSSYVSRGGQVDGGLVDGPVYSTIFRSHSKYITMTNKDVYADVQPDIANYHDDITDYTSNECTMDGTACLVYYLSAMQNRSKNICGNPDITMLKGAVVRMDSTAKDIYLCFTAHEFTDGFDHVTRTLNNHKIKASFFFTGDFCRTPANKKIIEKLKKDGHYIGAHSDKHLLYCSWENRDSLLVTKDEFLSDLKNNYKELDRLGVSKTRAQIFLPPYEWYNDSISLWTSEAGLKLVNNSSGTITNQDWTFPDKGKPYFSSDSLMKNFLAYEKNRGMNGYIMLIHPGTDPRRTDKFYLQLDSVLNYLESRNYSFRSFTGVN